MMRSVLWVSLTLFASLLTQTAMTSSPGSLDQSRGRIKIEAIGPVGHLYPGAVTNLRVRVENLSAHDVRVRAIAPNGPVSSTEVDCTDVGGDPASRTGVTVVRHRFAEPKVIPAGSTIVVLLEDAVVMNNAAAQSCQGVTYRIPLAAVTS